MGRILLNLTNRFTGVNSQHANKSILTREVSCYLLESYDFSLISQ